MNVARPGIKLGIIICTRNRPELIENLLKSISKSITLPEQIVLVSSGKDIVNIVSHFTVSLNLKHIHTEKIGQSSQKVIGIASLSEEVNWVFFLDDDLLILPDTIDHALEKITQIVDENIAGIGTQILPLNNPLKPINGSKKISFKNKIGKISSTGRVLSYQTSTESRTQWLNGASIWRKEVLHEYHLPILNSKYAAYEDVIFSTKVNKLHELIYDPNIKILEQVLHANSPQNLSAYIYINLWTGYFVCIDSRTKIINYKFLVMLRLIKFISQKTIFKYLKINDLVKIFNLNLNLIKLPNCKIKSKEIILNLIQREIDINF